MAGPQSTVNNQRALGVPGEILFIGPTRAQAAILDSASAAYNIIGATAFTQKGPASDLVPNEPITAEAGGTGIFAGILANPKTYASFGTANGGPLAPTMTLPNAWNAELLFMGEMIITVPAACNAGDLVLFDNTTGALATQAPSSAFTGVVATNTLTVTSFTAGGAPLKVGTEIFGTGVTPGTRISALGSGTGGNGTYTVTGAATVSSTAMTGDSLAPTGKTLVPNAVVERYSPTGAGLAVIKLTN
jgi:hypothetical protein